LDGLLHRINTHDRRIGAQVVEGLAPRAANVHFEDRFENGRMTLDYRLHAGVVEKSNALELMRSVGLEV
jgi:DNA mismatch repair ATPase MutS